MDKENLPEQPVGKKPRLSLSLGKRRFGESVSSNLLELTTPVVPNNTKKNTLWAMRNFREWRLEREKHQPDEVCCDDIFDSGPWDVKELCR